MKVQFLSQEYDILQSDFSHKYVKEVSTTKKTNESINSNYYVN